MSYTVLARKWRPDHFDEVVGQEHVATTLVNSIEQDRVAHSYLFCGARGVGKTSMARILAKAMNCKEGPTPRPCYECDSCREISKGQSVDVFEIDGASNRGINEIRELRDGVRYAPSRDDNKIYIIDEVHMLTTEAFNALLKTLEEPPEHAMFIFATTEPQKIPVTILSRCQRFDFKRISQSDIVAHLEKLCDHENIDAERSALQIIARQANGGMRDALSLLDQIISFSGDRISEAEIAEILGVANRKQLFSVTEAVLDRDAQRALEVLDEVNRYGYDLQQFASELVTHFRDLMVTAAVDEPQKVTQLTESELAGVQQQVGDRSGELLNRYFSVMVDGAEKMRRSGYPKLIFEMTLVRLAELEPMENLDLLVDRLEMLEETMGDGEEVHWPQGADGDSTSPPESPPDSEAAEESTPAGKRRARAQNEARATRDEEPQRTGSDGDPRPPIEAYKTGPSPTVESASVAVADDAGQPDTDPDAKPKRPQPLRPREDDEVEIPDVDHLESPKARWRVLVDYLRQKQAPVAAALEHVHLDRFHGGRLELRVPETYDEMIRDSRRRDVLENGLHDLFGAEWSLELSGIESEESADSKTLADERQEDIDRRRKELKHQLLNSPGVQNAREVFDAGEPDVSVKLYDE